MDSTAHLAIWPLLALASVLAGGLLLRRRLLWWQAGLCSLLVLAACTAILARQDYRWAAGVRQALPENSLLVQQQRGTLPQRPWTRLQAPVIAITAASGVQTGMETGNGPLLELELLHFEIHAGHRASSRHVLLDCARQDLVVRQPDGLMIETLPAGDPLLRLLCHP